MTICDRPPRHNNLEDNKPSLRKRKHSSEPDAPWRRNQSIFSSLPPPQCYPSLVPSDNDWQDERQPKHRNGGSSSKDGGWLSSSEHHAWTAGRRARANNISRRPVKQGDGMCRVSASGQPPKSSAHAIGTIARSAQQSADDGNDNNRSSSASRFQRYPR